MSGPSVPPDLVSGVHPGDRRRSQGTASRHLTTSPRNANGPGECLSGSVFVLSQDCLRVDWLAVVDLSDRVQDNLPGRRAFPREHHLAVLADDEHGALDTALGLHRPIRLRRLHVLVNKELEVQRVRLAESLVSLRVTRIHPNWLNAGTADVIDVLPHLDKLVRAAGRKIL